MSRKKIKVEEKVNEIYNHIDGLYKRFETLEAGILQDRIAAVEQRLSQI